MKNKPLLLLFLLFVCYGQPIHCQVSTDNLTPNPKFGKPTAEELSMTCYAPDSSAAAVVLYKQTVVGYEWKVDQFSVVYRYKTRIKILKEEGTAYANVSIPFYEKKGSRIDAETVSGLNATSYNLENGSTVRTKMKKEQVFTERINDSYQQVKFTVPQAKVGSVIEYEYQLQSDFYYTIRSWKAQEEIPTFYTEYEVVIPEFFRFNIDMRGTERLESKQEESNATYLIGGHPLNCTAAEKKFKGYRLPAIKEDDFLWCADNFCTQVNLELQGIEIPGTLHKNFTRTWEQIDDLLLGDEDFGGRLKMGNPLKEETAALLKQEQDNHQKIAALYTLLKSKVKWNETYALYGRSGRQTVKEGSGTNADINFILISMLKDAGIPAFPVVMSRRDQPLLPYSHPTLQKLTTFIVAIADTDSTLTFLDASVRDGYLDVLPPKLQTNRARLLIPKHSRWIDLQDICKNVVRVNLQVALDADGTLKGTRQSNYIGQQAADLRRTFRQAKDSLDFIRILGERGGVEVTGYRAQYLRDFMPNVQEQLQFEKRVTVNDDYIYLNPLVFLHIAESPFKREERKLPIEFAHTEQCTVNVLLTLPEGYAVDEMPENRKIGLEDKSVSILYYLQQQDNRLSLRYEFRLNRLLFTPAEYHDLKLLWETIAEKNNAMMVLKKL